MTMTLHCGMDFGTSNSTFAVAGGNAPPRLLPLEGQSVTLPSVIFFSFEDESAHFGRAAVSEYVTGADGRLMRSLKSVLGTSLFSDTTRIKRRAVSFAEILGTFIAEVRTRANAQLGDEIDTVVLGRPVRFVDDDDAADAEAQGQLESAARGQGFRNIEFQFEPIAAALDYEQQVTREELGLVIDIGGGTSDFSVIRVSPERARSTDRRADILSTAGVHVGGTDFDRLLSLRKVMPLLGYRTETADGKRPLPSAPYYDLATWHRINRLYNQKTLLELRSTEREAAHPELVEKMISVVSERLGHRLAGRVEEAKIELTDHAETAFSFETHEAVIETTIARTDFSAALEDSVDRIDRTIRAALADAEVSADQIDTLILTGGSTQVPAVSARIRELLPAARAVATDAFGSVGLGLALDAVRKFGPA
ncbi:MAG TPA: Hsp70 family protein [Devosia sp.]